jgi:serine/threonine protein kinase
MIGTQLLHYKITRKLGAGGMGEVFEAEDLKLGRTVALKFVLEHIAQDDQVIERFGREAKAVSRMDHPNVGSVFALEQTDDKTFLAMAYYQGETLRQRLDQARLSLTDALRFSLEIARGLEHAHASGVTHRDVKPANIFLARQANNSSVIKLLDFGLARLEDASRMMTTPGATTGTLMYMAPEQMRGQTIGHQVDVWAWGAVTFEMLAGRPPFVQENIGALLAAILSLEPDPLEELCPEAPARLVSLVKHALRKNPVERVENTSLIVQELEAIISGTPASSMGSSTPALSMGSSTPALSMGSGAPVSSDPISRVEIPGLKPDVLENPSSASNHPAFVSGADWSNPNWPNSEPSVEVVAPVAVKPAGSKSALWLLVPVALAGIAAGGFGIMNSRLSQPTVPPTEQRQRPVQPTVQPESSSKPATATGSSKAAPAVVESKPAPAKPTSMKPATASTKPAVSVPAQPARAEVKTPVAAVPVVAEPARATFSTPEKSSNTTRSNPPKTEMIAPVATAPTKPTTSSKPSSVAPAKPAATKTEPVQPIAAKPAPTKPSNDSSTVKTQAATTSAPVVDAVPKAPECKAVTQVNAVLERVLIASGNTLPLLNCGSYFHAKATISNEPYPEALEVRREVIALPNGTVMIADAVRYADTRKPLGLMPLPSDAKKVENADLSGGHQWRSESENITVNAMNLVYIDTKAVQTEGKGAQLETTSSDDPGRDFVFLTVYQGGTEEISNLNITTNDAHERNFAGVLLNNETAVFLGPGAQANPTSFDVAVPPGIKTYLIAGLEPGKNCTLEYQPNRNWWYISIKPGNDGTVSGAGVVVLETKAPTN